MSRILFALLITILVVFPLAMAEWNYTVKTLDIIIVNKDNPNPTSGVIVYKNLSNGLEKTNFKIEHGSTAINVAPDINNSIRLRLFEPVGYYFVFCNARVNEQPHFKSYMPLKVSFQPGNLVPFQAEFILE